jgi:hypothetical protein
MKIYNFKNFILERLGVAIPSIEYAGAIYKKTIEELNLFLTEHSNYKEYLNDPKISADELKSCIGNEEEYKKFPVVGISLDLHFKKIEDNIFEAEFNSGKSHSVGGSAYRFGHKNWSGYSKKVKTEIKDLPFGINLLIGIEVYIPKSYKIEEDGKLVDTRMETIYHELNHLYEYYGRLLNQKGLPIYKRSPKLAITYSDVNRWKIPNEVYSIWSNDLVYNFYLSEPYEINAQVQEAAYTVMKHGFDKLFETEAWKNSILMERFSAEDFIEMMDSEIDNYISKKGAEKTGLYSGVLSLPLKERLKEMWLKEYQKQFEYEKELPSIDFDRLKKNDCNYFIRYMGKRIKKAGSKLKTKLGKLYDFAEKKNNI